VAFDLLRSRLGVGVKGGVSAELKSRENRRRPRHRPNDSAWIRFEDSFGTRYCRLLDLSQTGARLAVANAHQIPDTFTFLPSKHSKGRSARVKWRRGAQIGIEFVSGSS